MKILHLLRKAPGSLFHEVLESQRRAHQLTIVLFPEAVVGKLELPGEILELAPQWGGVDGPRLYPRIDCLRLLELIFCHDRVFCW
ncbi:MAG: hypothetical protein WHX93_05015 [bacterium]